MNYVVQITTDESSKEYLRNKLIWLLDLMEKEHHHASTHSQRNAYQAVIRVELEIMRDELQRANLGQGWVSQSVDDIPY